MNSPRIFSTRTNSWALCAALCMVLAACSGEDGQRGFPGVDGPRGPQGEAGADGEQGETGERGPQGEPGLDPRETNQPPIAQDDRVTTHQNEAILIRVLANDSDPEGVALGVLSAEGAANGTLEVGGDGTVTYTPKGIFIGEDQFTYTAVDIFGATDTATVTVKVQGPAAMRLTILHNNDGESAILNAGRGSEDFGGVDFFLGKLNELRTEAALTTDGSIMLSSGDNFLAGPEFAASLRSADDIFYDARVLSLIEYDAICLGNHDFDFGPDVLAEFIAQVQNPIPYVNANLDFSQEPTLQALRDANKIIPHTIVQVGEENIGVVGVTTEGLASVSSPRGVVATSVLDAVQREVDDLTAQGVNKIILISHLQSINEDVDLVSNLSNVDVVISGGGDELLANPGDLLLPGESPLAPYPVRVLDSQGNEVPIVTTEGSYRYIGRLIVEFDADGKVIGYDKERSGPIRITSNNAAPDTAPSNPTMRSQVRSPVNNYVQGLAARQVATTEPPLDGVRGAVRTQETNLGNLVADAFLWRARLDAPAYGLAAPDVAFANGGGIRNDSVLPPGSLSELDTFDILPFGNFVSIMEDVPVSLFKALLENSVSRIEDISGRFAHVAGVRFSYDLNGTPQEVDEDGRIITVGTRIRQVELVDDNGVVLNTLVNNGQIANPNFTLTLALPSFLARGGDDYPFQGAPFTILGITDQLALLDYLTAPTAVGGLNGQVLSSQYPAEGEGRITRVE